jgi:hypothetical protein
MSRARDLASNAAALDALADIQSMLTARGVGVVSETNGVPTGAIVESGSNPNGTFTKFADGTAIIRMNSTENRSVTGVLTTTISTPIPMVGIWRGSLTLTATENTAGNVTWWALDAYSENSVAVRIVRSTTGNTSFAVLGYGRWY